MDIDQVKHELRGSRLTLDAAPLPSVQDWLKKDCTVEPLRDLLDAVAVRITRIQRASRTLGTLVETVGHYTEKGADRLMDVTEGSEHAEAQAARGGANDLLSDVETLGGFVESIVGKEGPNESRLEAALGHIAAIYHILDATDAVVQQTHSFAGDMITKRSTVTAAIEAYRESL